MVTFRGKYRFLSNFFPAIVYGYPTVEHAYQAAKTTDKAERERIRSARTPAQAKKLGRQLELRPDWTDDFKLEVMETLLCKKFGIPMLHKALQKTGDMYLCETNHWCDNFWGDCQCRQCENIEGHNHLGKLLMKIRAEYPLDPKSGNNWSYNRPAFREMLISVIAGMRKNKWEKFYREYRDLMLERFSNADFVKLFPGVSRGEDLTSEQLETLLQYLLTTQTRYSSCSFEDGIQ